jgi:hypothetical protein
MKRKLRSGLIIVTVLVAIILVVWRFGRTPRVEVTDSGGGSAHAPQKRDEGNLPPVGEPQSESTTNKTPMKLSGAPVESLDGYAERLRADPLFEFKIPMRFYGKVVDEGGMPVPDAAVHFEWNGLTEPNNLERRDLETTTDAQGRFEFEGHSGKRLFVKISRSGYATSPRNPLAFEYGNPGDAAFHRPDPQNPVIFKLRKHGPAASLIKSQRGIRPDLEFTFPLNGAPVVVDLLKMKEDASGSLEMSQMKPAPKLWKSAEFWWFKMALKGGGFIECRDEFPFEAPEGGYESTVELSFRRGETNWTDSVSKEYYFRFGSPPLYGRMRLETAIDQDGARLNYVINSEGTRSLEIQ